MKEKKKFVLAGGVTVALLVCMMLAGTLLTERYTAGSNRNLTLQKGVIATCDSVEKEFLSADMAIDGDDASLTSRWSSENNWEDASHYIQLEFPEEISVSFVVLKWERRNVVSYALEGSLDGETWEILQNFDTAPAAKNQEIVLDEAVRVRHLRLSTYAVSKEESDYSNLYQNVSLYEFEVYADKPAAYLLEPPVIETAKDGSRKLVMSGMPAGYAVTFIGADLEQVIGMDGTVYETIQDKDVTVGYRVEDHTGQEETREISFTIHVPAYDTGKAVGAEQEVGAAEDEEGRKNACPEYVVPSLAEWSGGDGVFALDQKSRIIVESGGHEAGVDRSVGQKVGIYMTDSIAAAEEKEKIQELWEVAQLFAEQCRKCSRAQVRPTVCKGTMEDIEPGDIYLGYVGAESGLGKEGYTCYIDDSCVINAETAVGARWGTVTLMQILSQTEDDTVPQGQIRDYPLYEVRGFGIDVARKAVSLDTLYAMMDAMSWYKMNDLAIHLNDNVILSTSGLTGSPEQAMTADSAFRLESDLFNEEGETLTSQEYAYTKEEIADLIVEAKVYGVTVVPEIDTPAHSLAVTKLYPAYALRTGNEAVDQIDLSNEQAVALVERIWRETLDLDTGAFRQAQIVNIGMDEYYGDGEQYRQFLTRIQGLVQETGKTVRLWGSLSNIGGTTMPDPENLQMNLWSTTWADPREMYEAGYSLINMQNSHLYIIPGGGYDYLDNQELYDNWEPNKFYDYNQLEEIPPYSPQMLGAAYMIWNDMSGNLDVGISEYDLFERFIEPLPVLSVKLWGSNIEEQVEKRKVQLQSVQEPQPASVLLKVYGRKMELRRPRFFEEPDENYYSNLYAGTMAAEPSYAIGINVRLEEDAIDESGQNTTLQEQILAEGDSAYGKWAFYAVEPETGKVGFTRESRTYTFEYSLPRGEWVEMHLLGRVGQVSLYIDGQEIDTVGSSEPFEEHATFVFPLQRIGEQTAHFDGEMKLTVFHSASPDGR